MHFCGYRARKKQCICSLKSQVFNCTVHSSNSLSTANITEWLIGFFFKCVLYFAQTCDKKMSTFVFWAKKTPHIFNCSLLKDPLSQHLFASTWNKWNHTSSLSPRSSHFYIPVFYLLHCNTKEKKHLPNQIHWTELANSHSPFQDLVLQALPPEPCSPPVSKYWNSCWPELLA